MTHPLGFSFACGNMIRPSRSLLSIRRTRIRCGERPDIHALPPGTRPALGAVSDAGAGSRGDGLAEGANHQQTVRLWDYISPQVGRSSASFAQMAKLFLALDSGGRQVANAGWLVKWGYGPRRPGPRERGGCSWRNRYGWGMLSSRPGAPRRSERGADDAVDRDVVAGDGVRERVNTTMVSRPWSR